MHSFREYVNPYLGELLEKIKLDKEFIRGEGCYLYDRQNQKYLDCIANYGAVPFGHNPPEIWDCITKLKSEKEPSLIKPSALNAAGELAEKLIEVTPDNLQYVTFTNSGAESVEAAIKMSRSATGRNGILATNNSFHGKTLGALSATGNKEYQKDFGAPVSGFDYINYGDLKALTSTLEHNPERYAAFILEPIQGEGGIITPPENYLKSAKDICEKYDVIFILDEIQSGLGRTGNLFALEAENVTPDIILLAKALGGGIFPIGACISSPKAYNEKFANKHSSTFAGNSLGCRIGLKVINKLNQNQQSLIKEVKRKGEILKDNLKQLQNKYPEIIKSIRGRGYMLGIEFPETRNAFPDSLLGIMAEQELLTPIISSFLLNNEYMRVAPTLNGNNVIRVEPPLIMSEKQCLESVNRIENMLKVLQENNTARFISYLINTEVETKTTDYTPEVNQITPANDDSEGRYAFLIHPLDLENYREFDKSLKAFSQKELSLLTSRWNNMVDPFVVSKTKIKSPTGAQAYGEFIALPRTTKELLDMPKKESLNMVKEAMELSRKRGAKIVGLGAYTAVVTMGGLYVRNENIPITTGNSYTVVAAVDAVNKALRQLNVSPESSTAAIVGATGSIGNGASKLISQSISRLILIGNPNNKKSSRKRLFRIAGEIYQYLADLLENEVQFEKNTIGYKLSQRNDVPAPDASLNEFVEFAKRIENNNSPIIITTSIEKMLPEADVTICATNTIKTLIKPKHLKHGAVVCDISRPKNVSETIDKQRPDVLVIDGGVIEVPGRPDLGWDFGFEKGLVYACMAETMMLALEHHYENISIGSSGVNLENILYTRKIAQKHGFKLADLRSFDRPLSKEKWNKIINARERKEISV